MRADLLAHTIAPPAAATERYEERKREFGDTAARCSEQGVTFIPMVAEAHGGGWGPEARRAFVVIKRVADATGEDAAAVADQYAQRRSVLLQKENSRAVLRRLLRPAGLAAERLAAATVAGTADAV